MGSLQRFDLSKYVEQYDLSTFVETGTFRGHGVERAIACSFKQVFSVEIVDEFYKALTGRFDKFPHVKLIHGDSVTALEQFLPNIDGNIFFWLDAHFPGADGGLQDFNSSNEQMRLPLESELRAIRRHRNRNDDVILIDDLRIYEAGEYASGNLPDEIRPPSVSGIDFIFELFSETHHILRLTYDEGYVLLLPNTAPPAIHVLRSLAELEVRDPVSKVGLFNRVRNWLK